MIRRDITRKRLHYRKMRVRSLDDPKRNYAQKAMFPQASHPAGTGIEKIWRNLQIVQKIMQICHELCLILSTHYAILFVQRDNSR